MSVMMKSKQKVKPHQGETLLLNTWKNRSLLAMAIPVIVLLILFNYIPMFGLVVAFKDFNYTDGIFGSPWVGLKNFKFLFSMKDLTWRMLRNTIGYYLLFTAVGTVFNVALAVALNECYNKYFKKYSHAVMILPTFISYITVFETVVGSLWTVFICSMFGYVLSRKTFRLRKFLTVFLLITMLFRGGGLSEFIIKSNYYQLRNNLLVLILPGVGAYTCFVMRTFIQSNVHESLIESAKLDGAGEFYIYTRIVLPLIKPVLAALGLMEAIGHWNQWQTSLLYMSNPKLATLQQILMKIQNSMDYFKQNMSLSPELAKVWATLPKTSTKMAIVVVTTGPIIIAYPFFQKYFIKGITIGSVKG